MERYDNGSLTADTLEAAVWMVLSEWQTFSCAGDTYTDLRRNAVRYVKIAAVVIGFGHCNVMVMRYGSRLYLECAGCIVPSMPVTLETLAETLRQWPQTHKCR